MFTILMQKKQYTRSIIKAKLLNLKDLLQVRPEKADKITQISCHKRTGKLTNYIFRYVQCSSFTQNEHVKISQACLKAMETIVNSDYYLKEKYCLTILKLILKRFASWNPNKKRQADKVKKNEVSQKKSKLLQTVPESSEIQTLKSDNLKTFFKQLSDNQVVIQNPLCVCCSKVFTKNAQLCQGNRIVQNVVGVEAKDVSDPMILQRVFNSISNQGGGTVVIGVKIKQNSKIVSGLRFQNEQQIFQIESRILSTLLKIKQSCNYHLQRVIVHTNYALPTNIDHEFLRFCFRIRINPIDIKRIKYIEYLNISGSKVYQTYRLNNSQKPQKVVYDSNTDESLYTFLHNNYKMSSKIQKITKNPHPCINCYQPHNKYSQLYTSLQNGEAVNQIRSISQEQTPKQNKNFDEPKILYQHASLLIVTSKKYDRCIHEFGKALTAIKQIFDIVKPFQHSITNVLRSIWMISHKVNIVQIKEIMKNFQLKGLVKPGQIKLMPVYKHIEIQRARLSNQDLKVLKNKIQQRYGSQFQTKEVEILDQQGMPKIILYLSFNNLNQAIFAYITLQSFKLRPYFVKDTTYKKKPKTASQ